MSTSKTMKDVDLKERLSKEKVTEIISKTMPESIRDYLIKNEIAWRFAEEGDFELVKEEHGLENEDDWFALYTTELIEDEDAEIEEDEHGELFINIFTKKEIIMNHEVICTLQVTDEVEEEDETLPCADEIFDYIVAFQILVSFYHEVAHAIDHTLVQNEFIEFDEEIGDYILPHHSVHDEAFERLLQTEKAVIEEYIQMSTFNQLEKEELFAELFGLYATYRIFNGFDEHVKPDEYFINDAIVEYYDAIIQQIEQENYVIL